MAIQQKRQKTQSDIAPAQRPDAFDRLRSLYSNPPPHISAYFPCGELANVEPHRGFVEAKPALAHAGASEAALRALEARLQLPVPPDMGGWAIFASDDGSTVADFAPEGPAEPFFHCGALPVVAPLLEWEQWRVPHLVATISAATAEIVLFVPGLEPTIMPATVNAAAAADRCRQLVIDHALQLIVVSGEQPLRRELATRLEGTAPINASVVDLGTDSRSSAETIATGIVRHVSDVVARNTVRHLQDFRFHEAHNRTVQGNEASFATLAAGTGGTLLVHDDPTDMSLASFGDSVLDVSASQSAYPHQARRVDVAIWSAVQQGLDVRIVPSTSDRGPNENIGLTLRDTSAAVSPLNQ